jgi:hypothetical protein
MSQAPHQERGQIYNPAQTFDLLFFFLAGHIACFLPFLRKHFGTDALGMNALAAMGLMFLYAGFAPCPEMGYFAVAWFACVAFHRVVTLAMVAKGWESHSRNPGLPWLAMRVFRVSNDFLVFRLCEPALLIIAGAVVGQFSDKLGLFIGSGAFSLLAADSLRRGIENGQIKAMRDKEFEMRARVARFRNGR